MGQAREQEINTFVAEAERVFPGGLQAVVWGSLVRGDFLEGRSDANLLVVAPGVTLPKLAALGGALARFTESSRVPPLLFDREEWARAADVFPVEITDMRQAYRVLAGDDPLRGQRVKPTDLRRALERELRGKVLRLQHEYALAGGDPHQLGRVAATSVGSFRVLLRVALVLSGLEQPGDDEAMLAAAAARFGMPVEGLIPLLAHRRDQTWSCPAAQFEGYLQAVTAVTRFVDHFQTGDR